MDYNKKPNWVIKNTIFYVDNFNKDIFECTITSIIDENTVSILPATHANNKIPKTLTIENIGKDFFWVLQNAINVSGFYTKINKKEDSYV